MLASLKDSIKQAQKDEQKVLDTGKRSYGIDFEDVEKQY